MNKHTPGPWVFGIRNYDDDCNLGFLEKPFDYIGPGFYENPGIFGADGTEVVGCDEYSIFSSPSDARLIAAAPDLLEALQSLIDMDVAYKRGAKVEDAVDAARAAIAKATGVV